VKVVDELNEPLPGVNISLNNIALYSTDLDGLIEIESLSEDDIIEFSYLGFETLLLNASDVNTNPFTVRLKPQDEIIEEVLIVGRTNALDEDIPFRVESISAKEIKSLQAQTSADVLAKDGSVFVQKSQLGGGSPVIRGFEANKILLVVDGVRMNNAIYRGGHLQNAITIDPAILNRMELIYGPGSLLYGSDALGGVIHFRTKNPLIDSKAFTGSSRIRYSSANQEKSGHVHFSLTNNKNLASLTSLSFASYDDLRAGKNRDDAYPDWGLRTQYVETIDGMDIVFENPNPHIQIGTSYSQFDLLQKFIYKPSENIDFSMNLQFSNSSDIPRYDFLNEYRNGSLRYAEWNYGPQLRLMISPRLELRSNSKIFDTFFLTTAYQKINEDRIVRNFDNVMRTFQLERLNVASANADFVKEINRHQTVEYGVSYAYNHLNSEAYGEDIFTNQITGDVLTRYPSNGNKMSQSGIYALHRLNLLNDFIKWNVGLRFSNQQVDFDYLRSDPIAWPESYYDGISISNNALVWMTGINLQKNDWQLKLLGGSAFRAPNIDDLAKVRVNSDEITVPNPNLIPEKTNNLEANFQIKKKRFFVGTSIYYSWLRDLIVRRDFTLPDGSPLYINNSDTLNVTANVNSKSGRVYGGTFSAKLELMDGLTLDGSVNYTKGIAINDEKQESPLDHIPPIYGKVSLEYEHGIWNHKINYLYNGNKPVSLYGGSADNLENATIDGTPSWYTLNAYTSFELTKHFSFNLGVENILDVHYRPFASGLSGAGRNFIVSVGYEW